MRMDDLETPVVIVDLAILERNIDRMQRHLSSNGINCRPHFKTHKIPAIAHMQIAAGAVGVTCQKLSEAEVAVNAGIRDVVIPYNIVGQTKIERLLRLNKRATLTVTVDSEQTLRGLSEAASMDGSTLSILVECDTGGGRAGVQTPGEAVILAQSVDTLPGVRLQGLLTMRGGAPDLDLVTRSSTFFEETIQTLTAKGLSADTVSAGGIVYANLAWPDHRPFGVNECRPGVYAYQDLVKVSFGMATLEDCAMRVVCTVVSRPTPGRAILDGGSKTFSQDGFQWVEGFGHVVEHPGAAIAKFSEEHGVVEGLSGARSPAIGDRVTVIPNYCNTVTNLHDVVYGVRDAVVETVWPVAARGAIH